VSPECEYSEEQEDYVCTKYEALDEDPYYFNNTIGSALAENPPLEATDCTTYSLKSELFTARICFAGDSKCKKEEIYELRNDDGGNILGIVNPSDSEGPCKYSLECAFKGSVCKVHFVDTETADYLVKYENGTYRKIEAENEYVFDDKQLFYVVANVNGEGGEVWLAISKGNLNVLGVFSLLSVLFLGMI